MRGASFSNDNNGRPKSNRSSQQPAVSSLLNNSFKNTINSLREPVISNVNVSTDAGVSKMSTEPATTKNMLTESVTKSVPAKATPPCKQVKKESDALLSNLFTTMVYPDITFLVDEKSFPAHRGILATGCSFFRTMFATEDPEAREAKMTEIEIEGISAHAFKAFLEYIYRKEVNLTDELAFELLKVSSQYSLPDLNKISGEYLIYRLTVENFVKTSQFIDEFGIKDLRTPILKFMSRNLVPLREREDLTAVPVSILIEVLDLLQPKEADSSFVVA